MDNPTRSKAYLLYKTAADLEPGLRSRVEWGYILDWAATKIRSHLHVGEDCTKWAAVHAEATRAVNAMQPVSVGKRELELLRERSNLLGKLEAEVMHCCLPDANCAKQLLQWLRSRGSLRGERLRYNEDV